MPSTTQNNEQGHSLESFIDSVCSDSHLRVEQDFGGGFVRLRSSEAEKRQAAQDIRSSEDIVIEMLRNARDAGAKHIFVALHRDEGQRTIVIIDDGVGIPRDMQARVFEPRVTSKLDSAHMDKWGMHGRGMALYSVSVNARKAYVRLSEEGLGSSLCVVTDLTQLPEKTDQSTFPRFEVNDGVYAMRGPRNILRTCAEFALEHRNTCNVYCGSFTEIASTLYEYGMATTSAASRAFGMTGEGIPLVKRLAHCSGADDFAAASHDLGLEISERSARRIMDGTIKSIPSLVERLQTESMPSASFRKPDKEKARKPSRDERGLKITEDDANSLKAAVESAYAEIADRYFLEHAEPEVRVTSGAIHITIPVEKVR